MFKAVIVACLLSVVLAEEILNYDAEGLRHLQKGEAGNAVTGEYSYTGPDGQQYTIKYVADENGYRAEGDHLPVAPKVEDVPTPVTAVKTAEVKTPASTYSFQYPQFYQYPYFGYAAAPYGFSYGYTYPYAFRYY